MDDNRDIPIRAKPTWQRARVTYMGRTAEIWVRVDSRARRMGQTIGDYKKRTKFDSFEVNVRPPERFEFLAVESRYVELLARDATDFLFHDPEFLGVDEWLKLFESVEEAKE